MKISMQHKALKFFESAQVQNWAIIHREGFCCEWTDNDHPNWLDDQSCPPYTYRVLVGPTDPLKGSILLAKGWFVKESSRRRDSRWFGWLS